VHGINNLDDLGRSPERFYKMTRWIQLNLIIVLSTVMIGCSTIHTRLSSSPGEVEELFPSTRRTAQYFSQEFSDLEISQDPYVTAFLIAPVLFVYSLVEYVPAIATDVVLLPMDAYNISRKSAKERQEREEFLTQQQEERIEPVK